MAQARASDGRQADRHVAENSERRRLSRAQQALLDVRRLRHGHRLEHRGRLSATAVLAEEDADGCHYHYTGERNWLSK